jgi:hypothetical protein
MGPARRLNRVQTHSNASIEQDLKKSTGVQIDAKTSHRVGHKSLPKIERNLAHPLSSFATHCTNSFALGRFGLMIQVPCAVENGGRWGPMWCIKLTGNPQVQIGLNVEHG